MIVKSEAIVLQTKKFGDSSKIAVLYTREYGKISVIAKGAFTSKSKFGGALSPLSYVDIIFYKKSTTDLHLLKEIEIIKPLNKLSENYENLLLGLTICEFLLFTQLEYSTNDELFSSIVIYLQLLNNSNKDNYSLSILFLFKLSNLSGFLVDFSFAKELPAPLILNKNCIALSLLDISVSLNPNSQNCYSLRIDTLQKISDYNTISLESPKFMTYLNKSEFIEVVNFFNKFFMLHLDKYFSVKSISLLI